MAIPGFLALLVSLLVSFIPGQKALSWSIIGLIIVGFLLALMMDNREGAWDNAKKLIEDGNCGGRDSEAHKAAVVGILQVTLSETLTDLLLMT